MVMVMDKRTYVTTHVWQA